jgi:hypothetical protein
MALTIVFDDGVACKVFFPDQARTRGQETAAKGQAKVFGFGNLKEGEHPLHANAISREFFRQRENAGFAGDLEQSGTVVGVEPTGPLNPAGIEASFNAVTGKGPIHEFCEMEHVRPFPALYFTRLRKLSGIATVVQPVVGVKT